MGTRIEVTSVELAGTGQGGSEYDLLVIGAGSAAFAAAITAREAGRTVALVESGASAGSPLGGVAVGAGAAAAAGVWLVAVLLRRRRVAAEAVAGSVTRPRGGYRGRGA
ncbi:MAG: FAD-binding protein [Micromonosporaceae bacterium]|nr:FAD-binding protein [Micromonosporaceae bacterium]